MLKQHGPKTILEKEFDVDLHDSIGIWSAVLPDDLTVGTAVNCPVRVTKMRSVKYVESFDAKLQHRLLVNGYLLEKRSVQINISGAYDKIPSCIPRSQFVARTRCEWFVGKCCRVEILTECPLDRAKN